MPTSFSMNYKVRTIKPFETQAKRLLKKFPSLKTDLRKLFDSLSVNPELGSPLGNQCFKVRIAISSKGKGKSGGARVITHYVVDAATVYLLSIYDKSELASLNQRQIERLVKFICDTSD